ncbi:MAG: cyclomaltodextrinase C-terminal domain-containing protein, partial [Muribaculaceae bacterium]|nr:cyclomaltodextrinase C-terminal domain-containing protein [Muribaculaceae bacterium]
DTRLPTVMDFRLSIDGRKFFNDETTPWTGLNGLYDHLSMDFLFPDPQKILTFLDNHDTDRFLLEEPENLDSWKQAVTFLLTSRGIPQLYYGTELLMNGSKEGSDGYVRKDFPGGFPGDTSDSFTAEGRTPLQNEAWDYLSALLRWRRDVANDVIARGSLKHFMPINCAYIYERRLGDKSVIVMINGTDQPLPLDLSRYAEIMTPGGKYTDPIAGEEIILGQEITLSPRRTLILQNF